MNKNKTGKILLYLACTIVLMVVVWGFSLVGSPSFNRKLSADSIRIANLKNVQYVIERYFKAHLILPPSLQDAAKEFSWASDLEDPLTKIPYEYEAVDEFNYELCATFELNSEDAELEGGRNRSQYAKFWAHDVGRQCFKFEIPQGRRKGESW